MAQRVKKAVLPVAGMGTRVLPGAKTTPKNLLNVVDRPILSYVVEEARAAGIEHFVFIVGRGQGAIEDYFDSNPEIEGALEAKGKAEILADVRRDLPKPGEMSFIRQMAPLGLGHAVWCAKAITGDEPFAVLLPDDLMAPGALKDMVAAYNELGGNILLTEEVPKERTASYGVITPGATKGRAVEVKGLVEKPRPEDAPSNLAVIGRYILQPELMRILDSGEKGAGGEIQLTDAMAKLIGTQPFHAVTSNSARHDCGDKAGFVLANLALGLEDPAVGPKIRDYLAGCGAK